MLNTSPYETLTKVLAGLDEQIAHHRSELDACIMVGAPYILALVEPGKAVQHDSLTYGETYPDMNSADKTAFRYHRRHDTCGLWMFTPANAEKHAARPAIDGKRIVPIHYRDWHRIQLTHALALKAVLEPTLAAVTNKCVNNSAILCEQ